MERAATGLWSDNGGTYGVSTPLRGKQWAMLLQIDQLNPFHFLY